MTHSPQDVLFARHGRAGLITLNRPQALNAVTLDMIMAMHAKLKEWAQDPEVGHVIIDAAGEKAFSAGGDIRALYEIGKAQNPAFVDFYRHEYQFNTYLKRYRKPYIALIDGIVMGGGVGVSFHGSHRIAGDRIMFAMPETGIGLFPDVGGTWFLPRCPGETGMYLGLTGARLKAADTLHCGLATHYVPSSRFAELKAALCDCADIDAVIAGFAAHPGAPPLDLHRAAIDKCFAAGSIEAILQALSDTTGPDADFAQKTIAALKQKSPTSLKITYRQLREGAHLSFEECMKLEFRIVNRIFHGTDFFEGTRAVVIDKDNQPNWRPSTLSEVSDAMVDAYFAPLGKGELVLAENLQKPS